MPKTNDIECTKFWIAKVDNKFAVNSIADYIGDTLVVGSFVFDKLA